MNKIRLHQKFFLASNSTATLGFSLLTNGFELNKCVQSPNYRLFQIPKKTGGYRQIMEPDMPLKTMQKNLSTLLQNLLEVPNSVHGFVKTTKGIPKHIKSNASQHLGKKWVYNIDIQNFFGSINATQVQQRFKQKPFEFSEEKSKYLALLVVFNKQLPAGAPSSPIISNMVCEAMDIAICDWVQAQNELEPTAQWCYTRYADDLTFSCNEALLPMHQIEIHKLLQQCGFERKVEKDRLFSHLQGQWVTGIKVNVKPNVDRRQIRKLRAILHNCRKHGLEISANRYLYHTETMLATEEDISRFLRILTGKIDHIGFVRGKEDNIYLNLKTQLNNLLVIN